MTKPGILVIFFIFLNILCVFAQNGFSEWETGYFSRNATDAQKEFVNKVRFPHGTVLPDLKSVRFGFDGMNGWNVYLKKYFAAYFTESKSYAFDKKVSLVYGILNLGNFDTFKFQSQLKSSVNDTLWTENLLNSLFPIIKESWGLLDGNTRSVYSEILNHTEKYLQSFSYKQENEYYQKLVKLNKEEEFILSGCKSGKSEYRKAEAFIFRRISDAHSGNGNWTLGWMIKMIRQLKVYLGIV